MSGWKLKITFLLPFSDNHYTFVKTPHMAYFHGDASADRYSTYIEKHTDYILSYTEPSSLVPDVDWLATGYVSSFQEETLLVGSQGSNTLPVGTILPYVGNLSDIPHGWVLCDGTNGTPNLTGRFLQGWGWDDFYHRTVGEYIQEGLPNIKGFAAGFLESWGWYSGALYGSSWGGEGKSGGDQGNQSLNLDASRSSWIYGSSLTVQPRAFVVYYIMRII